MLELKLDPAFATQVEKALDVAERDMINTLLSKAGLAKSKMVANPSTTKGAQNAQITTTTGPDEARVAVEPIKEEEREAKKRRKKGAPAWDMKPRLLARHSAKIGQSGLYVRVPISMKDAQGKRTGSPITFRTVSAAKSLATSWIYPALPPEDTDNHQSSDEAAESEISDDLSSVLLAELK